MWQRFAEGLGISRSGLREGAQVREAQELIDSCFDVVRLGFTLGSWALCVYEHQTSEVSKSKIEGLEKRCSIGDDRSLQFFTVHVGADEWHSEGRASLIADLNEEEQGRVVQGAKKSAKLLWGFLDRMMNAGVCH